VKWAAREVSSWRGKNLDKCVDRFLAEARDFCLFESALTSLVLPQSAVR